MITRLHYRRSEPLGECGPLNRFGRMYPSSLCTSRHLDRLRSMMWRRRIGIAMMVFFLPVNAPFCHLATEALGWNVTQPDWFIGLSFLGLFLYRWGSCIHAQDKHISFISIRRPVINRLDPTFDLPYVEAHQEFVLFCRN